MILKLNTSPRPDTGAQLDLVELHVEHDSWAGKRRVPHSPHFCSIRRPAFAPSKNSRISGVMAGTGLLIEDIRNSTRRSTRLKLRVVTTEARDSARLGSGMRSK